MTDPQGSPFKEGVPRTSYVRAKTILIAYDADGNEIGEPLNAYGLIPISIEPSLDLTQPEVQAELLEMAAEGIKTLAESKKEESTTNSNKKETA